MSDNPYESPSVESVAIGVKSGKAEDVKSIAIYQKGILVCILVYLVAAFAQFAVPPRVQFFVGLSILLIGLVAMVFVLLLAIKVYHSAIGILCAILTMVPCLGLLMLLVINGKATSILKQNGHRVGLLGADLSKFGQ